MMPSRSGAMHGQMRRAVDRLALRVEPGLLQGAPVVPAALVHPDRPHGLTVEPLAEPEPIEDARRVRPHVDAAADFGQLRRLLVDLDVEPGPPQRQRRGQPADPGADDGDFQWGNRHVLKERGRDARAPIPPSSDTRSSASSPGARPGGSRRRHGASSPARPTWHEVAIPPVVVVGEFVLHVECCASSSISSQAASLSMPGRGGGGGGGGKPWTCIGLTKRIGFPVTGWFMIAGRSISGYG